MTVRIYFSLLYSMVMSISVLITDPARADEIIARSEIAAAVLPSNSSDKEYFLTPPVPTHPRINGPKVYGCRQRNPFIYKIPCTGVRPIVFSAANLPAGLQLDKNTGIITGAVEKRGETVVTLRAINSAGENSRTLRIVCGDTLALTPPMGFNDWYAYFARVTDKTMRNAADVIVSSGMADAGYSYVNIDDCWARWNRPGNPVDLGRTGVVRDKDGNILTNTRFPDMKKLTDYIHAKGLKAGIYSSPGPATCGGFSGSYQHEAADVAQIARWGFDFYKYDWCSYGEVLKHNPPSKEEDMAPYSLVGNLLKTQKRDIVYNLCQYGMNDVWEWAPQVNGNAWRTDGDLGGNLDQIFDIALKNAQLRNYCHPGGWNDPDYLLIGYLGDYNSAEKTHPCGLTHTEQYSFMSLWCMIASPLFYSGDIERLDPFTLNVLCNNEVIDIDQDSLGKSATAVAVEKKSYVLVKDLDDGSKAVGLCNRSKTPITMKVSWKTLGLKNPQIARDVWRQKDLGRFDKSIELPVPARGVFLLRFRSDDN